MVIGELTVLSEINGTCREDVPPGGASALPRKDSLLLQSLVDEFVKPRQPVAGT